MGQGLGEFVVIWFSHIDNIASFRDGTLLFDIERHVCRSISKNGKIAYTKPKYAFMIDHCGAAEKGVLFRKPLSALVFKSAVRKLDGYVPETVKSTVVRYSRPGKNRFISWEDCVCFAGDRAGTMIGLVQKEPVDSLDELLKKTLPSAVDDWNALARELELRHIDNKLFSKLTMQAIKKDRSYPKSKTILPWPKAPWRFWFEQE